MTCYGFDAGRQDQLLALAALTDTLPARLAELDPGGWRSIVLAGIGASHAALASPLHQLRAAGRAAWRTDCADLPAVGRPAPDVLIAISQSGRSTETVDVVGRYAAAGVPTVAITNADDSPLGRVAGRAVTLGDRPDSRVSTVGFMITCAALGQLTDLIAVGEVSPTWAELPELISATTQTAGPVLDAFAEALADGALDVVAEAAQGTTAEAVTLLFREGPLIPASAYGTRSYLHGPMDVAGDRTGSGTRHVLIGGVREAGLAAELAAGRSGEVPVLLLAEAGIEAPAGVAVIRLPGGLTPTQRALVEVGVLQGLVARAATVRGNPVDDSVFVRQDTKLSPV
ncbi:SIS domain-containing protein [Microlunatus speluncae]|uniref:SIS domain-containing protein n=1 Tax=Microlunatus speluncae TaxID=2594267 RepID=UPI001C2CF612|nr:SIS domain-containing protein [Microlunatus speluncae]